MRPAVQFASRVIGFAAVSILVVSLTYASRFGVWKAPWSNDGLFGWRALSPFGDIVRRSLAGTPFSELDIIIWGCGAILVLSALHWLTSKLTR